MTSSLRTTTHQGLTLRSTQSLHGWKPDLAVAIYHHVRGQPCAPFTADLVKVDALFADAASSITRRDRINRLYDVPLQVEGLVFRIESGEKSAMYQKTRKLVVQTGALAAPLASTAHLSTYQPALQVPAASELPYAPPHAAPYVPPASATNVTAELRQWKDDIEGLLMSYGVDPRQPGEFIASEDRIRKLKLRMTLFEDNLDLLAIAIREIHPTLSYKPKGELLLGGVPVEIEPLGDV